MKCSKKIPKVLTYTAEKADWDNSIISMKTKELTQEYVTGSQALAHRLHDGSTIQVITPSRLIAAPAIMKT